MKFLLRASISILLATMLLSVLPVSGEEKIYDSVVRLHVLANSDSAEDQALKLRVRDELLTSVNTVFSGCKTADAARKAAAAHLDSLQNEAQRIIKEEGYDYPCTVTLTQEEYPTRAYDGFSFPAGTYTSLRVLIGEAAGQNWWCVLFPPLCVGAATASDNTESKAVQGEESKTARADEKMLEAGFTPKQVEMLTETKEKKTIVKFKLLEILESWFGK